MKRKRLLQPIASTGENEIWQRSISHSYQINIMFLFYNIPLLFSVQQLIHTRNFVMQKMVVGEMMLMCNKY